MSEVGASTAAAPAFHPEDQAAINAHVKAMRRRVEDAEGASERRALYAVMQGRRIKLFVEHGEQGDCWHRPSTLMRSLPPS